MKINLFTEIKKSHLNNQIKQIALLVLYLHWSQVKDGVQQGYILVTLLFLVCINDLSKG